jgi:CelD/BcsL family acetyltransferase involved in cellulose biosynthesis
MVRAPHELALRVLHRLPAQRWGEVSTFLGHFGRFATVCRAAASRGELAVDVLRAGDEVGAVVVSFEFAGRISYDQGGRIPTQRWRTAGTVLLSRVFEDAARRGLREGDLLRGDEAYKAVFADGQRELWRLRSAIGWRAHVALPVDLAAERGRRLAGRTRRWLRSNRRRSRISAQ